MPPLPVVATAVVEVAGLVSTEVFGLVVPASLSDYSLRTGSQERNSNERSDGFHELISSFKQPSAPHNLPATLGFQTHPLSHKQGRTPVDCGFLPKAQSSDWGTNS